MDTQVRTWQPAESSKVRTPKSVEAYHIAEPVRQLIADEFLVVRSTRRLAKKHKLSRSTVNDILHLQRELSARRVALGRIA